MYIVLETVLNIIMFLLIAKGADIFFASRKNKLAHIFINGMLILICVTRNIMYVIPIYKKYSILIILLPFITILFYMLIACTGHVVKKILYVLMSIVVMIVIETALNGIVGVIFGFYINERLDNILSILALLVEIVIYSVILISLRNLKLSKWKINTEILKSVCVMLTINVIMMLIFHVIYQNVETFTKGTLFLMMSSVIFCMAAMNIAVFYTISKINHKENQARLEFQYMQAQEEQNQNMETVIQNLRQLRHDMNNHVGMLYGLCDTKQYDLMHKYLKQMMESTSQANDIIVVQNNQALSVVLNNKKALAQQYQIPFDFAMRKREAAKDVKEMPFSEMEVCSLFGNILDNAIEACREIPHKEQSGIKLQISELEDGWQILCRNRYMEKPVFEGDSLITHKSDTQNHGIGTKAMKSIIKKHKGKLEYEVTEEEFSVKIFMPY